MSIVSVYLQHTAHSSRQLLFGYCAHAGVSKGAVIGIAISMVLHLLVPLRYVFAGAALAVLAIPTAPFRAMADLVQGFASASLGSLSKAARSSSMSCNQGSAASADPRRNRAAMLARYDVVADVVSEATLLRPQLLPTISSAL